MVEYTKLPPAYVTQMTMWCDYLNMYDERKCSEWAMGMVHWSSACHNLLFRFFSPSLHPLLPQGYGNPHQTQTPKLSRKRRISPDKPHRHSDK